MQKHIRRSIKIKLVKNHAILKLLDDLSDLNSLDSLYVQMSEVKLHVFNMLDNFTVQRHTR